MVKHVQTCSNVTIDGNSTVVCSENKAETGGALLIDSGHSITFKGNSSTVFNNNHGDSGGAINL